MARYLREGEEGGEEKERSATEGRPGSEEGGVY
jgi:hypothetical protein